MKKALLVLSLALVLAPQATAARRCSLTELEGRVMCPTCKTTLDQSTSPVAERIRSRIRTWSAAGWTCGQIESELVDQFGPAVLAAPPKHGFGLLAWVLPLAGLGLGVVVVSLLAWRWSRRKAPDEEPAASPELNGRVQLDPELERKLDEELAKFDG